MFQAGGALLLEGLILFFLSLLLIQIIKQNATRIQLIDVPNQRSSHTVPTPRGAGIAIYFSLMVVLTLFHFSFVVQHIGFFGALLIIFITGVIDDLKPISARVKLIVIMAATLIIYFYDDLKIVTLGNWFGVDLQMPYVISIFFTMFAVAGFTNALNLIDGLDGLAGSISVIILAALFYIGYIYQDQFILYVTFFTIMAILGFLLYNWYPATIFMGDSGSLVLGFIISAVAMRATHYISDTAILYIAALPIIDTIIVMVRRIQRGVSPFAPDKTHLHHQLVLKNQSVDGSVHLLIAVQIILSSIGILLRDKSDIINLVLFLVIMFVFFHTFDSRKEIRHKLLISHIKQVYLQKIKNKTRCNTLRFILIALVVLLVIRFLFA